MIEFGVVAVLVLGVVAVFRPAHRGPWRGGFTAVVDRDRARLADELYLLESFEASPDQWAAAEEACQDLATPRPPKAVRTPRLAN
jgi:hypothetical protein